METIFETEFRGEQHRFGVSEDDRAGHLYIVGRPQMGKTSLALALARHDLLAGRPLAYVDTAGGAAQALLAAAPALAAQNLAVVRIESGDDTEKAEYAALAGQCILDVSARRLGSELARDATRVFFDARARSGAEEKRGSLYVDSIAECDHLALKQFLDSARASTTNLVLVHRYRNDIPPFLFETIQSSVRNAIFFSLGPYDASVYSPWMPHIPFLSWAPMLKQREVFTTLPHTKARLPAVRARTAEFPYGLRTDAIQSISRVLHQPVELPLSILREVLGAEL